MLSEAKSSSENKRKTILRVAILAGAVAVLLGFLGYNFYQRSRVESSFRQMEKVQREASQELAPLSEDFAQFQAHPEVAKKLKPKFKKAQNVLNKATRKLKAINPPSELATVKEDLILLDVKSAGIYQDLVKLTDYLVQRDATINKFSKATEDFDKAAKQAKTAQDIIKAGQALKGSADGTVKELEELDSPIKVYSNQLLEQYLKELSLDLSLLEEGIKQNDVQKVEQAGSKLGEVFSKDWTQAVWQEDKKDVEKYKARVKEISRLYQQVQRDMIEYSKGGS